MQIFAYLVISKIIFIAQKIKPRFKIAFYFCLIKIFIGGERLNKQSLFSYFYLTITNNDVTISNIEE